MMYEELVKQLKEATGWKNASKHYSLMKQAADRLVEYEQKEATIMKLTGYTLDQLIQFFAAGSTLTPPSDSSSLPLLYTFFSKKL